jgi:hypothetical protein
MNNIFVDLRQGRQDIEVRFKSELNRRFTLTELRGVAVKYYGCLAKTPKQTLVDFIWRYFRRSIYTTPVLLPVNNDGWYESRRLPTQPDPIPEFARDLENIEEDVQDDWLIDRTPSYTHVIHEYHPITTLTTATTATTATTVTTATFQRYFHEDVSLKKKFGIYPELLVKEGLEECDDCPICYESVKMIDIVEMGCNHKFCSNCISISLQKHYKREEPCCALCRGTITKCVVYSTNVYDKIVEYCDL